MRPTNTVRRALDVGSAALGSVVRNLDDTRRIVNFIRGRLSMEVRPDDVFISSYPRSGTTLTQWIVYLLAHGEAEDPMHLTQVSPWFERSLAIGELDAESLDAFPSPRVFKSHLPRHWLPDGARYIYVERHVEDVLVSYFHFYQAYLGFDGTLDAFFERFQRGDLQYGSWLDHVAGWREHASDPDVLILAYERLVNHRRECIARIAAFLDWRADDLAIERVLAQSSFDAMKAREAMFDHATALLMERGVRPRSFLRAGEIGQGAQSLSEPQLEKLKGRASRGRRLGVRGLSAFLQ